MKGIFFLMNGFIVMVLVFLSVNASFVYAYNIEDLTDVPVANDFVLAGSKVEIWLDPGQSYTKELLITNRLGKRMDFKINIEDFEGSKDLENPTKLLGDERGPYSLKEYLKPDLMEFSLEHGQRIILPVVVSIPADAEPGGRYGSVLVSANPSMVEANVEKDKAKGQISIITRLASLFFVGVNGDIYKDAQLKSFKTAAKFYEQGPISFQLIFENNGKIHLAPYGVIEIYNTMGKKIEEVEVDPWFSMPDSLRYREIKWDRGFLFGRYVAKSSINRGYDGIIDQKQAVFWVIPWKILLVGLILLIAVISLIRWLAGKFEIKRK